MQVLVARFGAIVLAVGLGGSTAFAQLGAGATPVVRPNDPRLEFTEYVTGTIDSSRARLHRRVVDDPSSTLAPGARLSFSTDATRVHVVLEYRTRCPEPGCGELGLEVDGVPRAGGFGNGRATGAQVVEVFSQSLPVRRDLSLLFPIGAAVDVRGLLLAGEVEGLAPPVARRPAFRYVAYGDSITHGFRASTILETYPHRLGRLLGWSVVNMGFKGRRVVASDGGALGHLEGDLVTIAIGVNDHAASVDLDTFSARYDALLDGLRALQPDVPIHAITPIGVGDEATRNGQGWLVQDYRDAITEVVRSRADPALHVLDGLALLPWDAAHFQDRVHPNDAGFALLAERIADALEPTP